MSTLSSCSYYMEDFDYQSILFDSGIIVHCTSSAFFLTLLKKPSPPPFLRFEHLEDIFLNVGGGVKVLYILNYVLKPCFRPLNREGIQKKSIFFRK